MKTFRYLPGVSTLYLNPDDCVGCGMGELVCPHGVFHIKSKKATIGDLDGCMECGACATNCPTNAVRVNPGVGCAAYIIQTWIKGRQDPASGSVKCC